MNKLSLMPVGMLLAIMAQPAAAQPVGGCIATADLGAGPLALLNTVRVTHQALTGAVNLNNLCFQVVKQNGDVLGDFCQTLGLNESVTYAISEIFSRAHVPFLTPLLPNLLQIVETDGSIYTHDMQATYGAPISATDRVPLLFTCPQQLPE